MQVEAENLVANFINDLPSLCSDSI